MGPFAVTILDVAELQQGMASLDQMVQDDIQARALSQSSFVAQFADLPCPALDADGSCRVYPFRPVTCRMMGIPVEADGRVEGACDVQTFVPIVRLPQALRQEETRLAEEEEVALQALRRATLTDGNELLLPYGFLADRVPVR